MWRQTTDCMAQANGAAVPLDGVRQPSVSSVPASPQQQRGAPLFARGSSGHQSQGAHPSDAPSSRTKIRRVVVSGRTAHVFTQHGFMSQTHTRCTEYTRPSHKASLQCFEGRRRGPLLARFESQRRHLRQLSAAASDLCASNPNRLLTLAAHISFCLNALSRKPARMG